MGTNFYLRKVKPRMVYDEYHIAKRSYGWRIHFQDSEEYKYDDGSPSYHSVDDIRRLLESGEYQLVDEYDTTWGAGEDSLKEFDKLCAWNGGERYHDMKCSTYPNGDPPYDYDDCKGYRDPQGYHFDSHEFF